LYAVDALTASPVPDTVRVIILEVQKREPACGSNSAFAELLYIIQVKVKQLRLVFAGIIDALSFAHIRRPWSPDIGVVHAVAFGEVDTRVEVHPQVGQKMKAVVELYVTQYAVHIRCIVGERKQRDRIAWGEVYGI